MMDFKSFLVLIAGLLQISNCWVNNNIKNDDIRGFVREMVLDMSIRKTGLSPAELKLQNINLIFPGTKWCGPGNIADNYDDLGTEVETDKCCRAHDSCPDLIEAGDTKYNLTNDAFYSRLSCNCDETFRRCLQTDGSETSLAVGLIYFNVIGTQCFREDYKVIACKRHSGWLHKKCVEYEYDTNSAKSYQWFDVPYFEN